MNDDDLNDEMLEILMNASWKSGGPCDDLAALRALGPVDDEALDAHVQSCVVCGAQATHLDALMADDAVDEAELDVLAQGLEARMTALLQAQAAAQASLALPDNVVPLRAPARPMARRMSQWSGLALAATVLLAVGVALRPAGPPAVPDAVDVGAQVRGGHLDVIGPQDELTQVPSELSWVGLPGDVLYDVRLEAPDGTVLWQEQVVGRTSIALPSPVRTALARATRYSWVVEARQAGGPVIARSDTVRFLVLPD